LFDVDGVIINSEKVHCRAFQQVFRELFDFELSEALFDQHMIGRSIEGGFTSLNNALALVTSGNFGEKLVQVRERKIKLSVTLFEEHVTYYQDTLDFIRRLNGSSSPHLILGQTSASLRLGLVTGMEEVLLQPVFAGPLSREWFDVVITSDVYTRSKPDPEAYLVALNRLELVAGEVVGIEDSVSGIEALNAAGILAVGVTNTHSAAQLRQADIVVDSLMALFKSA
jgi:beta-phosphoglucomutase